MAGKSKGKLFIENFLVYGLGSIISSAIPFVMLPIITRLMPNSYYYGINDLIMIIISFGAALAVMGAYDAMFRMFFEDESLEYRKSISSTALGIVLINGTIIIIIMFLTKVRLSNLFFASPEYGSLIVISSIGIFTNAINLILSAPTRMENKRKTFIILNVVTAVSGYFFSIPMLLNNNYLYALPTGYLLSYTFSSIIYLIINRKWFRLSFFKKENYKVLLKLGVPLVPTFLIYWIFQSFGRVMVNSILGLEAGGIYAIGAKVASLSQLVYQAFSQGWQYFAFSTMKDPDNNATITKLFEVFLVLSIVTIICIDPFVDIGFNILFEGDYTKGSVVFSYLFLCPLLLMMFQTISNQFLVIKRTYNIPILLVIGVIFNIGLNFWLIPKLGVVGAAISTFVGYYTTVIFSVFMLNRAKLIYVNKKIIIDLIILIAFVIFSGIGKFTGVINTSLLIVVLFMYKYEIKSIWKRFIKRTT